MFIVISHTNSNAFTSDHFFLFLGNYLICVRFQVLSFLMNLLVNRKFILSFFSSISSLYYFLSFDHKYKFSHSHGMNKFEFPEMQHLINANTQTNHVAVIALWIQKSGQKIASHKDGMLTKMLRKKNKNERKKVIEREYIVIQRINYETALCASSNKQIKKTFII